MPKQSLLFVFKSKLNIQCLTNTSQMTQVVSLQWYDGKHGLPQPESPTLVICYDNGRLQMMVNESDESEYYHSFDILSWVYFDVSDSLIHTHYHYDFQSDPVLVDTAMNAVGCQWNHDGSILAVAGMMSTGGDKVTNHIPYVQ